MDSRSQFLDQMGCCQFNHSTHAAGPKVMVNDDKSQTRATLSHWQDIANFFARAHSGLQSKR